MYEFEKILDLMNKILIEADHFVIIMSFLW